MRIPLTLSTGVEREVETDCSGENPLNFELRGVIDWVENCGC